MGILSGLTKSTEHPSIYDPSYMQCFRLCRCIVSGLKLDKVS